MTFERELELYRKIEPSLLAAGLKGKYAVVVREELLGVFPHLGVAATAAARRTQRRFCFVQCVGLTSSLVGLDLLKLTWIEAARISDEDATIDDRPAPRASSSQDLHCAGRRATLIRQVQEPIDFETIEPAAPDSRTWLNASELKGKPKRGSKEALAKFGGFRSPGGGPTGHERTTVYDGTAHLDHLGGTGFRLLRPVLVSLAMVNERGSSRYVAEAVGLEAVGNGETHADAIADLEIALIERFEQLEPISARFHELVQKLRRHVARVEKRDEPPEAEAAVPAA